MLARGLYRARQFSNVLRGGLSSAEQQIVRRFLTPEQQQFFFAMVPLAQRHHLDVARDLLADGWDRPELLQAALLHDVGKGRLGVWPRVAIVLTQATAPSLYGALARRGGPPPLSWLQLHLTHADVGARMAAATGASPRTVELIRRHEVVVEGDDEQAALRRADDRH